MSNVQDVRYKGVPVELDGKEYTLRFDLNAFAELEESYGSVDKALKAMETGSIKAIRALIWAGILHQDETLTVKKVGAMITMDILEGLSEKLNKAMSKALPEQELEKKKVPNKKR